MKNWICINFLYIIEVTSIWWLKKGEFTWFWIKKVWSNIEKYQMKMNWKLEWFWIYYRADWELSFIWEFYEDSFNWIWIQVKKGEFEYQWEFERDMKNWIWTIKYFDGSSY